MTTDREQIIAAARACLISPAMVSEYDWNPLTSSADCAAMCAKLQINQFHWNDYISCDCQWAPMFGGRLEADVALKDHNNDREAAWRYAATTVAAKIGGMK